MSVNFTGEASTLTITMSSCTSPTITFNPSAGVPSPQISSDGTTYTYSPMPAGTITINVVCVEGGTGAATITFPVDPP